MQTKLSKLLICAISAITASCAASACVITSENGNSVLTPSHWITVSDTPFDGTQTDTYLWANVNIGDEHLAVPAWADGTGSFHFKMPMSLVSPWQDTPIDSVWLSDGEVGCEMTGFTRGALRKKTGVLESMFLGQAIKTRALVEMQGIDPDTRIYKETGEPVRDRDMIRPMIMAKRAYDVHKRFQAEAATNAGLQHTLDVLNAYLAEDGFVEKYLNEVTLFDEAAQMGEENFVKETRLDQGRARYHWPYSKASGGNSVGMQVMGRVAPKTPEILAIYMRMQMDAAAYNAPKVAALRDTAGTYFGFASGLATMGGGPQIAAFYSNFAALMFLETMIQKVTEGLYPESFEKIAVGPGPLLIRLNEDPMAGSIQRINVTPRAKGLNAAGLIVDAVINYFPFGKGVKGFKNLVAKRLSGKSAKPILTEGAQAIKNVKNQAARSVKQADDAGKHWTNEKVPIDDFGFVVDYLEGFYKQALGMVSGNSNHGNLLQIKPFTYPEVNVLKPGWYQARLDARGFFSWDVSDTRIDYVSKKAGESEVLFSTMPGKFAEDYIETTEMIRVREPGLLVSPQDKIIMPGDVVRYEASVVNMSELEFGLRELRVETRDRFEARLADRYVSDGVETREYDVFSSEDPNDFPSDVTFVTKAFKTPVTEARVLSLPEITPFLNCISFNESVKFQALDEMGEPLGSADWGKLGPGRIEADGTYYAPDKGDSEVTIFLKTSGGAIIDELTIQLGCSCMWDAESGIGEKADGTMISVSQVSAGETPNYSIMTMDGRDAVISMAGEGSVRNPVNGGVTMQFGDKSLVSGVPVYTDPSSGCDVPTTDFKQWSIMGDRWLHGRVKGYTMDIETLTNACPTLHPFEFSFTADLRGDLPGSMSNILSGMQKGDIPGVDGEAADILASVAGAGLNISACFDTGEID